MWFRLSLLALLLWSGSDLFSKIASREDDRFSSLKLVISVGAVMGIHSIVLLLTGNVTFTFDVFLTYLPISLLYISSMFIGYIGLHYIELSISSPICNSSGALASLMCFLFLHQTLAPLQAVAVALICVSVVSLGVIQMCEDDESRLARQEKSKRRYSRSLIAILIPVIYCLLDAAGTFADTIVLEKLDEDAANTAYELTFLFMGVLAAIYVYGIKREKFSLKKELPCITAGVFETGGQMAYVYAIADNAIAAAPIISSYCVLSVIWGRIFLKEHLTWKHYVAIGLTLVGIIALGFLDA